jgi:hypothetical protein
MVVGFVTMVLSGFDFVRSHGNWVPLATLIVGLLTFVPLLGFAS